MSDRAPSRAIPMGGRKGRPFDPPVGGGSPPPEPAKGMPVPGGESYEPPEEAGDSRLWAPAKEMPVDQQTGGGTPPPEPAEGMPAPGGEPYDPPHGGGTPQPEPAEGMPAPGGSRK